MAMCSGWENANIAKVMCKQKKKEMNNKQFADRLIEVTLLLLGLKVLNTVIYLTGPSMNLGDLTIPFLTNSYWIGNILFGLIIHRLTSQTKKVSISIGILSIVQPLFGGLFYLMTLIDTKASK